MFKFLGVGVTREDLGQIVTLLSKTIVAIESRLLKIEARMCAPEDKHSLTDTKDQILNPIMESLARIQSQLNEERYSREFLEDKLDDLLDAMDGVYDECLDSDLGDCEGCDECALSEDNCTCFECKLPSELPSKMSLMSKEAKKAIMCKKGRKGKKS